MARSTAHHDHYHPPKQDSIARFQAIRTISQSICRTICQSLYSSALRRGYQSQYQFPVAVLSISVLRRRSQYQFPGTGLSSKYQYGASPKLQSSLLAPHVLPPKASLYSGVSVPHRHSKPHPKPLAPSSSIPSRAAVPLPGAAMAVPLEIFRRAVAVGLFWEYLALFWFGIVWHVWLVWHMCLVCWVLVFLVVALNTTAFGLVVVSNTLALVAQQPGAVILLTYAQVGHQETPPQNPSRPRMAVLYFRAEPAARRATVTAAHVFCAAGMLFGMSVLVPHVIVPTHGVAAHSHVRAVDIARVFFPRNFCHVPLCMPHPFVEGVRRLVGSCCTTSYTYIFLSRNFPHQLACTKTAYVLTIIGGVVAAAARAVLRSGRTLLSVFLWSGRALLAVFLGCGRALLAVFLGCGRALVAVFLRAGRILLSVSLRSDRALLPVILRARRVLLSVPRSPLCAVPGRVLLSVLWGILVLVLALANGVVWLLVLALTEELLAELAGETLLWSWPEKILAGAFLVSQLWAAGRRAGRTVCFQRVGFFRFSGC